MTTLAWLAIAYAVTFVINLIPTFMPATWAVLAFFYVHYKLPLLVLTVGGAAFSSLGRLALALATRRWGRNFVPAKQRREIDALGRWLEHRPAWQIPLSVFIFSLVGFTMIPWTNCSTSPFPLPPCRPSRQITGSGTKSNQCKAPGEGQPREDHQELKGINGGPSGQAEGKCEGVPGEGLHLVG